MNTCVYDVQFPDGTVCAYGANIIAQSMYQQLDSQGRTHTVLSCILDHSCDSDAVDIKDKYVITKSGQKCLRKTTDGWKCLVEWKNGA